MESNAIVCRNLVKEYPGGVRAVNGLDLEVRRGECFGLLGPNGAGKTTTIEILEGLLEPTSGEVRILGGAWGGDDRALRGRLGISLQETVLSEKLSVSETLRLFRSFYSKGLDPETVIGQVELGEKADARVGKLSGGQKQRLAVACALVGDPELLFLDEPTTGLDPQSRRSLWEILRRLRSEGRTILLTTHYMDEAERLCDRVAIVDHGRVISLGSPSGLIATLGGEHIIEVRIDDGKGGEGLADPAFATLPGVKGMRPEAGGFVLTVSELHVALPPLMARVESGGGRLTQLHIRQASLEDVFVKLTGRHLRDDEVPTAA